VGTRNLNGYRFGHKTKLVMGHGFLNKQILFSRVWFGMAKLGRFGPIAILICGLVGYSTGLLRVALRNRRRRIFNSPQDTTHPAWSASSCMVLLFLLIKVKRYKTKRMDCYIPLISCFSR